MSRRLVAGLVAVVLALLGAFMLTRYVSTADQRAMQDLEPVSVIEVVQPVPAGTAAEDLQEQVTVAQIPASAVAQGALTTLDEVKGQVTTTDLQPGEQLLASRFTDPETFADSQAVQVPEDLQQVSVLLEPRRVLGGYLEPGDSVGVFISMGEESEQRTRMIVNHALVARVQNGITLPQEQAAPGATEEAADGQVDPQAAPPPLEGVMVTLAIELDDAEELVFAAEYGNIWLSIQPAEAEDGGDRTVGTDEVLP